MEQHNRPSLTAYAGILALFVLLTVVFTWPQVLSMDGVPSGDAYVFVNCYWLYLKALLSWQNPFLTDYIFYPQGVNLAFQSGTFGNFLLTLPVSLTAGPVAGVTASYLLTYLLAALFTFLLVHALTDDLPAAILAAVIYAFSYMHTGHNIRHLNVSSIHCLPMVLYALYRAMKGGAWGWAMVAGLFGGLTILTDQLQSIITAGASLVVVLWCLWNHAVLPMDLRGVVGRFGVMGFVALCVASPYLVALVKFMGQGGAALERGMFEVGGSNFFAGDLLGFVLHPRGYGMFSQTFAGWQASYGTPNQLFLGLIVIALLIYGVANRSCFRSYGVVWWAALVSLVLSLGPALHIGGCWQWFEDGSFIKLPFYYFSKLPLFAQIRTPDRFHIATGFAVALLAALALRALRQRVAVRHGATASTMVAVVLILAVVLEYLPASDQIFPGPVSATLTAIGREPGREPLLWLPLSRSSSFARNGQESSVKAMYYQTLHQKPILNGLLSRVSADQLRFGDPLLEAMVEAGNLDRMNSRDGVPLHRPEELDQICSAALEQHVRWNDLRQRYGFQYIVVQAPFDQPGWATSRYIECLTGQRLIPDLTGGLSHIGLR